MHRMVAVSTKECSLNEEGKYETKSFISFALYLILQELYNVHREHKNKFGNLVICLDNASGGYWRKDVYPKYKSSRKTSRDESPILWDEVFVSINNLLKTIETCLPWKVVSVPRAEADDIMLVLSRHFNTSENILILSPDKDMIQAQKNTENVYQYSMLTKKWIVPENKHDDMEDWLLEHVCLGDGCDDVPRIIDETEFSESFKQHIISLTEKTTPVEFKTSDEVEELQKLIDGYDIWRLNKKGERVEKDVFLRERVGLSTLKKKIEKLKGLDNFLDSHPLYRDNYKRNYTLVMEEGIPSDIWNQIVVSYKESSDDMDFIGFENFLDTNNLSQLKLTMQFDIKREICAADFGW